MQSFGIGKLAQKAGIAASAIRYYERIGLLPAARRQNGKRLYDDASLARIGVIQLGQRAGFSIQEIQRLLHEFPEDAPPSERWQLLSRQKLEEIEAQMQALQKMKLLLESTLNCACEQLEDCGA
jgi:MerR family transcriptional regulator, redox-sensitive transcriptional activator SoxR